MFSIYLKQERETKMVGCGSFGTDTLVAAPVQEGVSTIFSGIFVKLMLFAALALIAVVAIVLYRRSQTRKQKTKPEEKISFRPKGREK